MTDKERHSLPEIPCRNGFEDDTLGPDDSKCPVTRYRPEFVPSRLIDEARAGWFPSGIRHCLGCELCSPGPETSYPHCADSLIIAGGPRDDDIPGALGGALDAVVTLQIKIESRQNRLDWVTDELQIAHENETGEIALFVGCAPYYDVLIGEDVGYNPTDEARAAIGLLNSVGVKPVVLSDEVCCGGDCLHAGDLDAFQKLGSRNRDLLIKRGVKTIITICDDCRYTLENRYPGRIDDWDFRVIKLADFLIGHADNLTFNPVPEIIAIQPPDRYSDPRGLDSIRKLLKKIPELNVKEIEDGHPSTFGRWGQFDSVTKRLESDFLKAAESTGASSVLIPGTRMLIRLLEGRRPGSWVETSIKIFGFYRFLSKQNEKK